MVDCLQVAGKRAIWEEVQKCGFKYYIIESFNSQNRIGDIFLSELIAEGADISGAVAFSEVLTTNQSSLFRSRDWLSANQRGVFLDSVGS